ncbi:hypothetical protein AOA81_01395 [Methanomassiliicoccales archaeon RumEn M2]|nr:hypothetical protein AOA81_01395 [Methanomassiliicoccales archaeon RumEn M2]
MIAKTRAYISFDYDHDKELKDSLMAQSKLEDSPFEIVDMSIEEAIDHNWKDYARGKIKQSDLVIFICGKYTDTARGVSAEMSITHEEGKEYFLLCGRSDERVVKPSGSHSSDKIYRWTWDNLKLLISGSR